MKKKILLSVVVALAASPAFAVEPREEVEVSAGPVTALSCALQAMKTGDLSLLGSACPMAEVKSGLLKVGMTASSTTPEQFAQYIRDEIAKWTRVAKAANIKLE